MKNILEKFYNPKSKSDDDFIFKIIVMCCIILFAIKIAPKTLQNDTFYTLKIGEYIMQNGVSDLTKDMYSWHNLPYTYPHWLYDLSMYLIYNYLGGQLRSIYFNYNFYSNFGWSYIFNKFQNFKK